MLTILPLSNTSVDAQLLLATYRQLFNKSATAELDKKGIDINSPYGYLQVLNHHKYGTSVIANNVLKHFWQSYLIVSVVDMSVLALETDLHVTSFRRDDVYLSILSGNLLEWRDAIVDLLNENTTSVVRTILTKCLSELEKAGIYIFQEYSRKRLQDGTLCLSLKK